MKTIATLVWLWVGIFAEAKTLTAYEIKEVQGKKIYERVEVKIPYTIRIVKTFPKNANEPILQVTHYAKKGYALRTCNRYVAKSTVNEFGYTTELPDNVTVYFNLKM